MAHWVSLTMQCLCPVTAGGRTHPTALHPQSYMVHLEQMKKEWVSEGWRGHLVYGGIEQEKEQ